MNEMRKVGFWISVTGVLLILAMAILIAVSRSVDPGGVPVIAYMVLIWSGLVATVGLVAWLVGTIGKKFRNWH